MPAPSKHLPEEKDQLHPQNRHRQRYDFPALIASCPELAGYVSPNAYGDLSVDFKDPEAVKTLNKALLRHFYGIVHWDIPAGYLCPPIPGRADYIHYLAELLAEGTGTIPRGKQVKVLDIGVGANCIYPLIGQHAYGWSFVGSDIDPVAVRSAKNIVTANSLTEVISIRQQNSAAQLFTDIIQPGESFHLTLCNPPFHASAADAAAGTDRKWKNLGHGKRSTTLNFGGNSNELWCAGGEEKFVHRMIAESTRYAGVCLWFTSLISKKESLHGCYQALEKAGAREVKTIRMAQGQKVSRILAWTFLDPAAREAWLAKFSR